MASVTSGHPQTLVPRKSLLAIPPGKTPADARADDDVHSIRLPRSYVVPVHRPDPQVGFHWRLDLQFAMATMPFALPAWLPAELPLSGRLRLRCLVGQYSRVQPALRHFAADMTSHCNRSLGHANKSRLFSKWTQRLKEPKSKLICIRRSTMLTG